MACPQFTDQASLDDLSWVCRRLFKDITERRGPTRPSEPILERVEVGRREQSLAFMVADGPLPLDGELEDEGTKQLGLALSLALSLSLGLSIRE